MPKRKLMWWGSVTLVLVVGLALLVLTACAPAVTEEEVVTEEEAVTEDPASIARGGAMYDKWWKVAEGATEPTEDHPLWSLQTTNTRSGSTTWRCKECHGWDYKGKEGAYSSGSHYTGFPGIYSAGTSKTAAQLLEIMRGGDNTQHDFSTVMGEEALQDIANFLSEGLIDEKSYIDYDTKKVIGADLTNGKKLYDGTCASCHGSDGWMIKFGEKGVGTLANGNPWETLHKIRFGHPGTTMPRTFELGWSTKDAVDTLGYTQTLPEEPAAEEAAEGPPAIPHTLEGRDDCLMCHGEGALKPFPADHAGRTSDICQGCHQPAK